MTALVKINRVEPLQEHWLRIEFSDGAVKDVDLGELLARGGVFATIRDDRQLFEQVRVNADSRTIEWPGGLDLDPEVLYGRYEPATGARAARRIVKLPTAA
jgi:Protein of unknown function (DUF2442)